MAYATLCIRADACILQQETVTSGESSATKYGLWINWVRENAGEYKHGKFFHIYEDADGVMDRDHIIARVDNEEGFNGAVMPVEGEDCLPGNPWYVAP